MKKVIPIAIITLFLQFIILPAKAQEEKFKTKLIFNQDQKKELNVRKLKSDIRKALIQPSSFRVFFNKTFAPKLSVDLLGNSGLHLFTISGLNPIPTINIGTRINAGLIITL